MSLDSIPEKYRPGPHPASGEPFVRGEVVQEQPWHETRFGPPHLPTRELYEVSEYTDELVYVRDLTEEEFDQAMRDYEEAKEDWIKSNGVLRTPGALSMTGTFFTESGLKADGVWDFGKEAWFWANYTISA